MGSVLTKLIGNISGKPKDGALTGIIIVVFYYYCLYSIKQDSKQGIWYVRNLYQNLGSGFKDKIN